MAWRPRPRSAISVDSGRCRRAGITHAVRAGVATLTLALAGGVVLGLAGGQSGPLDVPRAAAQAPAPAGPSATRVFVPVVNALGDTLDCDAVVSVSSLGAEPTKAIFVLWTEADDGGPDCPAPAEVLCSGLLRPGSAWDFALPGEVGIQARSGVVFSLTGRRMSELGVEHAGDPTVADHVCAALAAVRGDCEAYAAFAVAWEVGATHFGVPLDRAAGAPLAAHVFRAVPRTARPGGAITSVYEGIGAHAVEPATSQYLYHAAPIVAADGLASTLYVQGAGPLLTSVEVWFKADGACDDGVLCRMLDIAPGAVAAVATAECVAPGWRGSVLLRSEYPLAAAVDTTGADTLATYAVDAPGIRTDATGAPSFASESYAAYGPLAYLPANGWTTDVTVMNVSSNDPAMVEVALLDAGGVPVDVRQADVCAHGSTTVAFAQTDALRDVRVGSLRVVSLAGGEGSPPPAAIRAVATLRNVAGTSRATVDEAMMYNLVPDSAAYVGPNGAGVGGPSSGAAVVVVPTWRKDLDARGGFTTEIAVTNHVPVPGWTDFAVLAYDQNGLVDVLCRRLGAGQTTLIDAQTMGLIPPGFRAAGVISATFWEHPVPADALGPDRQVVGLGAVAVSRAETRFGENIPGDEVGAATGIPLARWPDGAALPADPCGAAPIAAVPPRGFDHWQSALPVLADKAGFVTRLTLHNVGVGPTEVRLRFKSTGDCLRERVCSTPPIAPGEAVEYRVTDCVGPDMSGSVAIHSREPLRVIGESEGNADVIPLSVRAGRYPYDINEDGRVDAADRAVVEAARGTAPGDPNWNLRADLDGNVRIDHLDLDLIDANLCGVDRPPGTADLPPLTTRADAVWLPILRYVGNDDVCYAFTTARNLGSEPAKHLLVTWGSPANGTACNGPLAVTCGGLVPAGGAWVFPTGSAVPGPKSGVIYAFNMRPLASIGASVGGDEPAADYLCRTLAATLVGDCGAFAAFNAAFIDGADFDGVPLGRAAGVAVAAEVYRSCPGDVSPGIGVDGTYAAVGWHAMGPPDPALGNAHVTYVPLIYSAKAGFNSVIYVQNTGSDTAVVDLWLQAQDDCSSSHTCGSLTILPGDTVSPDMRGCVRPDWQGNVRLESNRPLAVAVDIFGRDILTTYTGVSPTTALDAAGAPLPAGGRTTAFGPLFFGRDTGWDTAIQVQNLSRTRPAQVRVEFLDAAGATVQVLDDTICAAGSQTFVLLVEAGLDGRRVGSVRVVSQRHAAAPSAEPVPIAALATLVRYPDAARSRTIAAGMYNLLAEREALARLPGAPGGTAGGVAAVTVEGVANDAGDPSLTSGLAISNFVPAPGWTDVAILFHDANGLIDVLCRRVGAGRVEYVDLAATSLPRGFRGAALVSATAWRHPVVGAAGARPANLVGLGVVAVTTSVDVGGDEVSVTEGRPLARVPAALGADAVARCAALPTPTPTTPTAVPTTPTAIPTTATPASTTATPSTPPTATAGPIPGGARTIFLPFAQQVQAR